MSIRLEFNREGLEKIVSHLAGKIYDHQEGEALHWTSLERVIRKELNKCLEELREK